MLSIEAYKYDSESEMLKSSKFKKLLVIGVASHVGMPMTLGFAGLASIIIANALGVLSAFLELKIISIITLLIILPLYILMYYKVFKILKLYYPEQIELPSKLSFPVYKGINQVITSLFAVFILLSGIFLKYTCKFIFCPVSFLVGGTKFYEIFKLLENYATYFNIFAVVLLVVMLMYIMFKVLILRFTQNK